MLEVIFGTMMGRAGTTRGEGAEAAAAAAAADAPALAAVILARRLMLLLGLFPRAIRQSSQSHT